MLDCLPHWNTSSFLSAWFPSSLPMLWRLSSTSDEVLIFHSSENCSFLQESAGAGSSYHKRYFNGGSAGYRWVRKAAMQWKRRPPRKGWRKMDFTLHLAPSTKGWIHPETDSSPTERSRLSTVEIQWGQGQTNSRLTCISHWHCMLGAISIFGEVSEQWKSLMVLPIASKKAPFMCELCFLLFFFFCLHGKI